MSVEQMYEKASKFTIGFDQRDKLKIHSMWDKIFETQQWSEGSFTKEFESLWAVWNNLDSVAFSSWSGGAMSVLNYIDVKDEIISFSLIR